jgi:hypothetical protein
LPESFANATSRKPASSSRTGLALAWRMRRRSSGGRPSISRSMSKSRPIRASASAASGAPLPWLRP